METPEAKRSVYALLGVVAEVGSIFARDSVKTEAECDNRGFRRVLYARGYARGSRSGDQAKQRK